MSIKRNKGIKPALILGAAIFVVALIMLLTIGSYSLFPAFFLALLLAFLTTIVIYLAFDMGSGGFKFASGASAPQPAATAKVDADAEATKAKAAEDEARKAEDAARAAEAEAARKSAAEAAEKAAAEAEAEAQKARAEEDEARQQAEAEQAAEEERRQAEARRNEEAEQTAEAEAVQAQPAADMSEDYDGDGVLEGTDEGTRPAGLDGPRNGQADDLKQIKGIGPGLEKLCNSMGFYHFDQVAAWTSDEVAWVDANLKGFKGRVSRDKWVEQAATLASGGETEFSKRVDKGDVY